MKSNISDAEQGGSLLPTRAVLARYDICDRTLDRWLANAKLSFPRPVVINRRRYFRERELQQWERARIKHLNTVPNPEQFSSVGQDEAA